MLSLGNKARIFLHQDPINMHKSFEGLSGLVETFFKEESLTGSAYFVFLNRRRDAMKVLYWDSDGFAIWHKRLEAGSFPRQSGKAGLIDRRSFFMLLEGVIPKRLQRRYTAP